MCVFAFLTLTSQQQMYVEFPLLGLYLCLSNRYRCGAIDKYHQIYMVLSQVLIGSMVTDYPYFGATD